MLQFPAGLCSPGEKKHNHSRFLKQVTSRAGNTDQLVEEKSNERKATTQADQMQGSLMQRRAQ